MIDKAPEISVTSREHRRIGDHLLPVAFLGIVGAAIIAWIAAILWVSWYLITSLLQ